MAKIEEYFAFEPPISLSCNYFIKQFKSRKLAFMKNLLLILTMACAMNVSAGDLPTLKVIEDKTFVLNINDWKNSELDISFYNEMGEEIYSESIKPSKMFWKEFNLQVLRKGNYEVVVSNSTGSITYDIKVSDQKITKISKGKFTNRADAISMDIVSKIKSIH